MSRTIKIKVLNPKLIRSNSHKNEIIEQIFDCFQNAASQDDYMLPPPDPIDARLLFQKMIFEGLCIFAVHVQGEGEDIQERIVGGLALERTFYPWAPNHEVPVFTNPWFYVMKDYRKGKIAATILRKATDIVAWHGGGQIRLTTMWEEDHEEKARFLQMCGFRRVGGVFAMDLPLKNKEQDKWEASSEAEAATLQ